MNSLYLIGSMRNPQICGIGKEIRNLGFDVYDDWHSPGPEADDWWQKYEGERGRTYKEALEGWHAKQVFEYDKKHLDRCNLAVLALPAGRSCHLEFGYIIGKGKAGYILFNQDPDRFDIMYRFATDIFFDLDSLLERLKGEIIVTGGKHV
jgi:hypothetical protein